MEVPPASLFRVVQYDSPKGKLAAYLGNPPEDGKDHPAIIWCFGGFSNSIGDTAWQDATPDNDQSANSFRKAGIVMMYPSLRGGNENPGFKEGFYGEVDDILAPRASSQSKSTSTPSGSTSAGIAPGGRWPWSPSHRPVPGRLLARPGRERRRLRG